MELAEFWEFFRLLWRTARWKLVGAVGLSVLLSLTEGVSVALVFPLIALLGDSGRPAGRLEPGPHTRWLLGMLAASHVPERAWLGSLLVLVLLSVAAVGQLTGVLGWLSVGIVMRLRQQLGGELYRAILRADWVFLVRQRASDMTHLLTAELNRTSTLAAAVLALISNGLVAMLMLGIALWQAPGLTLSVLSVLALSVPWQRRVARRAYGSGEAISARMREVFDSSMERLQNLKVVKAYGAQDEEFAVFDRRYGAAVGEMVHNEGLNLVAGRNFQLFSAVLLSVVVLLGLGPLHLTAGGILVFLFAFVRAAPRLGAMQQKVNSIVSELPAYAEIGRFVTECARHAEREDDPGTVPRLRQALHLQEVTFAYGPGQPAILRGAEMVARVGEVVALAGASGAGKSTVADLLLGLLQPAAGVLLVDGRRVRREEARAWRRQVAYVSQDTLLFNSTVRENLLWAHPSATEEELWMALRAARAGFVEEMREGLETVVGNRGTLLSHGQRQRIALARALLLEPSVLILDEATNSLDVENERAILETVRASGTKRVTLLISHRASAISMADRVYVLEDGAMRER